MLIEAIHAPVAPVENRLGYEVSFADMQHHLEQQYRAIEAVKSTTQHILAAASLIVALVGALQLFYARVDSGYLILYNLLIWLTMILYIALIGCCVFVLQPAQMRGPIKADWDDLYEGYVGQEDDLDVLKQRLSNYLNAMRLNEPIIDRRRKLTTVACVLLPVVVVLLFCLSLVPRSLP